MSSFDGQRGGGGAPPELGSPTSLSLGSKASQWERTGRPRPGVFLRRQISVLSEEAGVTQQFVTLSHHRGTGPPRAQLLPSPW